MEIKQTPVVSVIVPVYNVESFLRQCLDSIRYQTFQQIEIICVDDGSTDQSGSILQEYAQKDQRIRITYQENQGPSQARNAGIRMARGEYLLFVDSDDYLEENAVQIIQEKMKKQLLEVCCFNARVFDDPDSKTTKADSFTKYSQRVLNEDRIYSGIELFAEHWQKKIHVETVWTHMISRDFFLKHQLWFSPGVLHEDIAWVFAMLMKASFAGCINQVLYHRRIRDDSITSSIEFRHVYGLWRATQDIEKAIVSVCSDQTAAHRELLFSYINHIYRRTVKYYMKCSSEEQDKRKLLPTEQRIPFEEINMAARQIASSAVSEQEFKSPITWVQNAEGSYTLTMDWQGENSQYAWCVLDNTNEPYIKTKYSEDNTYTCNLSDGKARTVKCYVRIYTGEEYEQKSYKITLDMLKQAQGEVSVQSDEKPKITWKKNTDSSYTFTMEWQGENSRYAWYVLDNTDEPYIKTKYSEDNTYTYDLTDEKAQTIKCFVRIYTDDKYVQNTYTVNRHEILHSDRSTNRLYQVISTGITKQARDELYHLIISDLFIIESISPEQLLSGKAYNLEVRVPYNWECNGVDRSIASMLNGFVFLAGVFRAWYYDRSTDCKDLIKSFMMDWIIQNQVIPGENALIWHDDGTARRVHRMSVFYDAFKDDFSKEEEEMIEKSLHEQAKLLMDDSFYTKNHNHGMYQDLGVIAYALLVSEDETEKKEMLSKAFSRTTNYIEYVYSDDGTHKEHSPRYALDVIEGISAMEKIAEGIVPEFVVNTKHILSENIKMLIQDIQPDGAFPSVGDDSQKVKDLVYRTEFDDSSEASWIRTGGKKGDRPTDASVFPEGGYAFFRSSWDDPSDMATWLMFIAATHSSTHKHGDDLSFLLYHKGDLFVEAGSRDFNYSDPQTSWVYSGYAHNVLLIDGQAFPVKVGANGWQSILPDALKTRIIDYDISDESVYKVTGSCERFPGVMWKRSLEYGRDKNLVTVKDIIDSDTEKNGTLLFHIAEGVSVEQTATGWDLYRNEERVASVEVIDRENKVTLNTYRGNGVEPYYTSIFNGNKEPVYGTALTIDFMADEQEKTIETIIQLY